MAQFIPITTGTRQPRDAVASERSRPLLRTNIAWTFVGQVIHAASQLAILSLLARLGTETAVGEYSLALAITTPIFMVFNLHLRVVQATDQEHQFQLPDLLGLRLLTSFLAVLVVGVWAGFLDSWSLILATCCLACGRAVESISELLYGEFQRLENMRFISLSSMIRGICGAMAFMACYLLTRNVVMAIVAMSCISLACLLFLDGRMISLLAETSAPPWYRVAWHWARIRQVLFLAVPAGFVNATNAWMINIPRIALQHFHGTAALGLFAGVSYFMVAGGTIILAVNQSVLARLAKYASTNRPAFHRLLAKVMALNIACGAAGVGMAFFAGDFLLLHLFGYADPVLSRCFTIVMLAAGIRYAARPFVVALRAEKQMWSMAFAYVVAIASALLASLLLIPRYSLLGSAIACLTVACCELAAVIVAFLYARRRARHARVAPHAIDDPPGNTAKLSA